MSARAECYLENKQPPQQQRKVKGTESGASVMADRGVKEGVPEEVLFEQT